MLCSHLPKWGQQQKGHSTDFTRSVEAQLGPQLPSSPRTTPLLLTVPTFAGFKVSGAGIHSPTGSVDVLPRPSRATAACAEPRDGAGEAREDTEPTDPCAFQYSRKDMSMQPKTPPKSWLSGLGRAAAPCAPQATVHLQVTDLFTNISFPDNGFR